MRRRALVAWSGGKDAAWALHLLRQAHDIEVVGLLTTLVAGDGRVSMHGVRSELVRAQARAAGLPLTTVALPSPCPNAVYEEAMARVLDQARGQGVAAVAFGDLFLEDVRRYREERLRGTGVEPLFPLWGRATRALAAEMLAGGLRARLVCVDPRRLPRETAGVAFDAALLSALPRDVDPCGENGEFHTFVWDGPMLSGPLRIAAGPRSERDGLAYVDLLPSAAYPVTPAAPASAHLP